MATDPCSLSLVEAADGLRSGELQSTQLLDAALARIDAHEPRLHAFAAQLRESARQQAERPDAEIAGGRWRGPLHGIPIAIKDLCFTTGVVTASGTTVMADFEPDFDATVVEKLDSAGAGIVGKTMLTEGATGEHHPDLTAPVNPWNPDYWTGVSSSGSGVAVAAGFCFGALGSDTGGSIRFPAAACGLTGIKPTWGRVSRYGVFPLSTSLDHMGPMTRSAADAAAMLQAIAGHDPRDSTSLPNAVPDYSAALTGDVSGLRIGLPSEYYEAEGANPDVLARVRDAVAELEGGPRPLGQQLTELRQARDVGLEVRRQLEQQDAQPITERGRRLQQVAGLVVGLHEPLEVRDAPRRLDREAEAVGYLVTPRLDHARPGHAVEGVVDLDRR